MAQERPESLLPTSQSFLTATRCGSLVTSVTTGVGVGINLYPDATTAGGLYVLMPFIAAAGVTILLAIAWHMTLALACHARTVPKRSIAFGVGVALFALGIGVSGLALAALFGGAAALQAHQHEFMDRLTAGANAAEVNGAGDRIINTTLQSTATNLDKTGDAEGSTGIVCGKAGQSVCYRAFKNAAVSFGNVSKSLASKDQERDALISRAREDISNALKAIAERDPIRFEESARSAAANIAAANAIRFAPMLAGLDGGLAPNHARAVIDEAVSKVQSMALAISKQRRPVDIPAYEPIDAKRAIMTNPQAWGWIVAIAIEGLPLLTLGLLLALWRDDEKEPRVEILQDFERSRPRVMPVPAE